MVTMEPLNFVDPNFEEVTEGEEAERKEQLKTKWAQLEAVVGSEQRLELDRRGPRRALREAAGAMDGKAMVVCMSRRICVDLHNAIAALRPEWDDSDDDQGAIKVVMTGSASDPLDWQPHIRNKPRREALAQRFRDPERPVPDRHRARHVADRLRRAEPAHDVRRQADARPRPDAGHRPGQPGVPGQAGRAGRGLPRARRRAEAGAGDLHGERRHGQDRDRPGGGGRGHAGEVRGLLRAVPRLRLGAVDDGHAAGAARRCCRPRRSTSSRRRTARSGCCGP